MKTWVSYIKIGRKKYFIDRGRATEIMGNSVRRIASLGLPDSLCREIEYTKMGEIPFEWSYMDELTLPIDKTKECVTP